MRSSIRVPLLLGLVSAPVDACPHTVDQLAKSYDIVFPHGNRNAASHRWAHFVLDCAKSLKHDTIVELFKGFCPVSGSPVDPSSEFAYPKSGKWGALTALGSTGAVQGSLIHCCAPCICDAVEFLAVDTKTITDSSGEAKQHKFVVIGNPCDGSSVKTTPAGQLDIAAGDSTLAAEAPDVVCKGTKLEKAVLSDHGGVIIGMLHATSPKAQDITQAQHMCSDRAKEGFQSGMGQIFRAVAALNPVENNASMGDAASMRNVSSNAYLPEAFRAIAQLNPIQVKSFTERTGTESPHGKDRKRQWASRSAHFLH
jgi:hypothetical protein